jgi:rRNA maturation endonuclease Nob1
MSASIEYLVAIVLVAMAVSFCWGFISGMRRRKPIAAKELQFCINCGSKITPNSKFCDKCGSAQT